MIIIFNKIKKYIQINTQLFNKSFFYSDMFLINYINYYSFILLFVISIDE